MRIYIKILLFLIFVMGICISANPQQRNNLQPKANPDLEERAQKLIKEYIFKNMINPYYYESSSFSGIKPIIGKDSTSEYIDALKKFEILILRQEKYQHGSDLYKQSCRLSIEQQEKCDKIYKELPEKLYGFVMVHAFGERNLYNALAVIEKLEFYFDPQVTFIKKVEPQR